MAAVAEEVWRGATTDGFDKYHVHHTDSEVQPGWVQTGVEAVDMPVGGPIGLAGSKRKPKAEAPEGEAAQDYAEN